MIARGRVPATSANLGPGFDTLGLALALYNELTLAEADGVTVSVQGEGQGQLPATQANVVAQAARTLFEAAGRRFTGVAIECVNRIPLSRGLGSSAAAWLGGMRGANALAGTPLDRAALLALAARAVVAAARAAGALGCVLSGAGPSLLAAVAEDPGRVGRAMTAALGGAGVLGQARALYVDTTGAVVEAG